MKSFVISFRTDYALLSRFQKIDVKEPSIPEVIKILQGGVRSRYESYQQIRYTADALKRAVELSTRYIFDRQLLNKAIDIINEAEEGAYQQLQSEATTK